MARFIIHLHNIKVTLLSSSRPSLPEDLRLVAKILVDNNTTATSEESPMDPRGISWMLKVKSNVPSERAFSIEISGISPSQAPPSLFGSIEVDPAEIVANGNGRFTLDRRLSNPRINLSSSSFQLRAGFTYQSTVEVQASTANNLHFPLDERSILSFLLVARREGATINSSDLNIVYRSIQLLQNTNQRRSLMLYLLGGAYLKHYHANQCVDDLHKAVKVYSEAEQEATWNDSQLNTYLADHGIALVYRFNRLGDVDDILKSVLKLQEALQITPDDHPDKPAWFNNLGVSFLTRFEQLGDVADLNNCILNLQKALQLSPDGHPNKPAWLNNHGCLLLRRFEQLGDLEDLNNSILNLQNAVQLPPGNHPDRPAWLSNLGGSLLTRFEQLGDLDDLNNSILNLQSTVQLAPDSHPDTASWLNNFGGSLIRRFERLGDLEDLNNSILNFQKAVQLTPEGHPRKPSWYNNLGRSLLTRFEHLGDLDDLNNSILNLQSTVHLAPGNHPDTAPWFNNIGSSLLRRFEWLGDLGDLNESVLSLQKAVQLTPDGHHAKPSRFSNLGNSLLTRFEQLRDLGDLNESVLNLQKAVQLAPDGHLDKPCWLSNLGNSFFTRFGRLGDLRDLDDSILIFQKTVQLTPDGHPDKATWFRNLGNSLLTRFERLGDIGDGNESMLNLKNALQLTPDDHPAKSLEFNSLGQLLLTRFEWLGELNNLNDSILNFQKAVQTIPHDHSEKPLLLTNLGKSLFRRFEQLKNLDDVREALAGYSAAAHTSSGPPSIRFAASVWCTLCHHILQSPSLAILETYHVVINLLPQMAWLGSSVPDRHHLLTAASDTVCEAAAAAVRAGHNGLAVEWLEQGRSVIWGQLLQLRTPLDFLKSRHPKLGQSLEHTLLQLEGLESRQSLSTAIAPKPFGILGSKFQGELAKSSHDLAYKREQLLTEIRNQSGFETFLMPKPLSQLTPAACSGPTIMLALSPFDKVCNALIVLPGLEDDVLSLTLKSFTPKLAKQLYAALQQIISPSRIWDRWENKSSQVSNTPVVKNSEKDYEDIFERLVRSMHNISLDNDAKRLGIEFVPVGKTVPVTFEEILAELWNHVAKPVLDVLAIMASNSSTKPHLWWCPTGILSFLPFHAAGLYQPHTPAGSKLSEFAISSYTPSLTALLSTPENLSPPSSQPQLLIVAETSSIGQIPLPGTHQERLFIEEQTRNCVKLNPLIGAKATVENVVKGLKVANWVHFACHGVQHISQPTESALLLAGRSRLTLKNLMELKLSHRDLAFLSACQTATGDEKVPDEAVHLAAGMLAAGYRGVIATMWSVMDQDAPQVARDVYGYLFSGKSTPDPTEAAHALHHAVSKLCEVSGEDDMHVQLE